MTLYSNKTTQETATIPLDGQPAQKVQQRDGQSLPIPPPAQEVDYLTLCQTDHFLLITTTRSAATSAPSAGKQRKLADLQKERIMQYDTRQMPGVELPKPARPVRKALPMWIELLTTVVSMLVCGIIHACNMFHFPRYEMDEGTYMANAWAILNGLITPYPYGYGHPPLAWMQIASWVELTGGFFTFGNAMNSGRVLMLLYALVSNLLVYLLTRRLTESRIAALLALFIFSLSPLSTIYQRQVFLDNIAVFWLLLSLYLLLTGKSRLLYVVCSALSLGIAILCKEVFLLFVPALFYAVWLHTTTFQRKFALIAFTYVVVATSSLFVLLAILKGELFPYEWHLPGDTHKHLSMIGTFIAQGQRGQNEGSLLDSWHFWWSTDPVLMTLSIAAPLCNLLALRWNRKQFLCGLLSLSFWLLLMRGGVVFSFYLIPLIPITAINAALLSHALASRVGTLIQEPGNALFTSWKPISHTPARRASHQPNKLRLAMQTLLLTALIALLVPYNLVHSQDALTEKPTAAQVQTLSWIREHVPRSAFIVINSYLYLDLREPGGQGVGIGATYPYAHVYINVATDPEIYGRLLQNNWDRIDYIVADAEVLAYIKNSPDTAPAHLLKDAFAHAIQRAQFQADTHAMYFELAIYEVQHRLPPRIVDGAAGRSFT